MTTVEVAMPWAVSVVLCLSSMVLFYLYETWNYNTWKRRGVTGPKPVPFFGNMKEVHNMGLFQILPIWREKYGQTYGTYFYRRPMLITDDVEILKEVMIKDFHTFNSRGRVLPLQRPFIFHSVVYTDGEPWKRQRHSISPAFSAKRFKQMSKYVNQCCGNLVKVLQKAGETGQPIPVKRMLGSYTLDAIAGTGFSLETSATEDFENNAFHKTAIRAFSNFNKPTIATNLASIFPGLDWYMRKLGFTESKDVAAAEFIEETVQSLIQERKENGNKEHFDTLQVLLELEASDEYIQEHPRKKCLTSQEIFAMGTLYFGAGYEQTSNLLQYMSYCLAFHPQAQEKLYEEVVAAIGDEDPTYETVSRISYLNSCMFEALRLFPPTALTGREVLGPCILRGVTLEPGDLVMASICTFVKHESYYPEPYKFQPERFEKGGVSSHVPTFIKEMPFGGGPRQCIGMRLALFVAKMAMAAVVRKFKFVVIPETPVMFDLDKDYMFAVPTQTILLGVEMRQ